MYVSKCSKHSQIFTVTFAYEISWSLDKFRDFQTSFEFYTILNPFYITISIMHIEPNASNLVSFRVHGHRDVSWT
jgi:hypothetical protein